MNEIEKQVKINEQSFGVEMEEAHLKQITYQLN